MRSHLKVKVFSLSAEMTYIRKQELKWKNKARIARQRQKETAVQYAENNFWSLRSHRTGLKAEARTTHLAYGFLKGIPYSKMEHICYGSFKGLGSSEPAWVAIGSMVGRFTGDEHDYREMMQRFGEWLSDAQKWYEGNPERIIQALDEREAARQALLKDADHQAARAELHQKMAYHGRIRAAVISGKIGDIIEV